MNPQPPDDPPRRDWVFLPPALRPVALALSVGVVALWLWQLNVVRPDIPGAPRPPAPRLETADQAPLSQIDITGPAAGRAASSSARNAESALGLIPTDAAIPAPARAQGRAVDAGTPAPDATATMTEQARSARNEELIAGLELQKKKMGIASVSPDYGPSAQAAALRKAGLLPPEKPAAPVLGASAPRLMTTPGTASAIPGEPAPGAAEAGPGRPAPDAGLIFSDAQSLASSWILLGMPGSAPTVDFSSGRALLIKPSVSRIVSVSTTDAAVVVVYRSLAPEEEPNPVRDRFTLLPAQPETVGLFDATPR